MSPAPHESSTAAYAPSPLPENHRGQGEATRTPARRRSPRGGSFPLEPGDRDEIPDQLPDGAPTRLGTRGRGASAAAKRERNLRARAAGGMRERAVAVPPSRGTGGI